MIDARAASGSMARWARVVWAMAIATALIGAGTAAAFDSEEAFRKGRIIFTLQAGGGAQNNIEDHGQLSGISFVNFTPRVSLLPFAPFGPSWLRSAFEVGLEGWFQHYLTPVDTNAGGLKMAFKHHFLGLGPFVPYFEVLAGAGGTNLQVLEIRSTLNFVLEGGVGLAYFVTPDLSVNVGYRFQHISNGGTSFPNRGFNSDEGVAGVSFFFR